MHPAKQTDQKSVCNRKYKNGFTLIEVMVVLSILAIIAILSYNFFGSTMKDATLKNHAVRIHKDLMAFQTAYDLYVINNGTSPSVNGPIDGTASDFRDMGGYMKSFPVQGEGANATSYFRMFPDYDDMWNDGTPDPGAGGYGFSDDLCAVFNGLFTSLGETIWAVETEGGFPTPAVAGTTAICYRFTNGNPYTEIAIFFENLE